MLSGETQNFGIADILQLILKAAKSGYLYLDSDVDEVVVIIQQGWIVEVRTEPPREALLGRRLTRGGHLSHAQLGSILKRRAQTQRGFAEIAYELGLLDAATLRAAGTLIALDALFETFTWPKGQYRFDEQPARSSPVLWIEPISVEQLLTNGIRLVDEWESLRDRVPSVESKVLQQRALPPEPTPDEMEAMLFGGGGSVDMVDESERTVYELCHGGTIEQVLDLSPYDRYETFRCLTSLAESGYVRFDNPSIPPPLPNPRGTL